MTLFCTQSLVNTYKQPPACCVIRKGERTAWVFIFRQKYLDSSPNFPFSFSHGWEPVFSFQLSQNEMKLFLCLRQQWLFTNQLILLCVQCSGFTAHGLELWAVTSLLYSFLHFFPPRRKHVSSVQRGKGIQIEAVCAIWNSWNVLYLHSTTAVLMLGVI